MSDDQLDMFGGLDDEAHARNSDPWTSHAAARSLDVERLRETQKAVLACFVKRGKMCHEQLVERYGPGPPLQSVSGLRTRCHELVDAGYLRDSGKTIILASGRSSIIWELAVRFSPRRKSTSTVTPRKKPWPR